MATMAAELAQIFGHSVDMVDWLAVEKSANFIWRRAILDNAQVITSYSPPKID